MELIVETNLGRDPDDFFALCYLIAAGVKIRAITISPGDLDQVAVAKFLLKEVGLDIPVGVGILNRVQSSDGGVHTQLLKKYKFPSVFNHDGLGSKVIRETHEKYRNVELFCIGPLFSVGEYLLPNSPQKTFFIKRATMQGGFIGYDIHKQDVVKLNQFKDINFCSTYNLDKNYEGSIKYITSKLIREREWIGENICCSIEYNEDINNKMKSIKPQNRATELLRESMNMHLNDSGFKKFNDPVAAVCMLHPEIVNWVKGEMYCRSGKWGALLTDSQGDNIAIDIDKQKFWEYITKGQ